nr:MAG TPA: hypothetical protein [Caudoviricetes sp.]
MAFFISGSREPSSIRLVVKSARWACPLYSHSTPLTRR